MGRAVESLERGGELHFVHAAGGQAGTAQGLNLPRATGTAAEAEVGRGEGAGGRSRPVPQSEGGVAESGGGTAVVRASAAIARDAALADGNAYRVGADAGRADLRATDLAGTRERRSGAAACAGAERGESVAHTPGGGPADPERHPGLICDCDGRADERTGAGASRSSSISARTRDLIEESEVLSARARSLQMCHQALHLAMTDLSESIAEALKRGGFMGDEVSSGDGTQYASPLLDRPQ